MPDLPSETTARRTDFLYILASRVPADPKNAPEDSEIAATLVLQELIEFEQALGQLAPKATGSPAAAWKAYTSTHAVSPSAEVAVSGALRVRNFVVHGLKGIEVSIDEMLESAEGLARGSAAVRAIASQTLGA